MKCRICCTVFTLMMLLPVLLYGKDTGKLSTGAQFQRSAELRYRMLNQKSCETGSAMMIRNEEEGGKVSHVGILFSALVPGTGEFYAGSWLKGAIFLGVEVGLWIGYWQFSENGQEWEDLFHVYANEHWNESEWREWMGLHPEFGETTHTLPSTKTQQYYEMIGKYNQFKAGWDDYDDDGPALTANRNHYEGLRHNSNVQFKRASYCAMVSIGNRILSAFDTALIIRTRNRQVQGKMRMSMKKTPVDWVPCLALRVEW